METDLDLDSTDTEGDRTVSSARKEAREGQKAEEGYKEKKGEISIVRRE